MIADRELSEMVATKVMGWRKGTGHKHHYWYDSDGKYAANVRDYLPGRDAGLALEAAMKAGNGDVRTVADRIAGFLVVVGCATRPVSAAGSTIARALSLAALRAALESAK